MDASSSAARHRELFFTSRKVVFLYPEVAVPASFSVSNKHLGASYIRAYLKTRGIPTTQFLAPDPLTLREATEQVLAADPAVLCVTVYDCTYHTVKMLVGEIKRQKPELKVILGGPTATFSDRLIMDDFPEADVCVRGEGEYALYEILDAIYREKDYTEIHGTTCRAQNGGIVCNPDRPLIRGGNGDASLDILPSPYLEGIVAPEEAQQVGIITSRGCAFHCVYCNFSAMSRWTVRFHSVDRVMRELEYIAGGRTSGGASAVTIQDDAFTLNKNRAKEICRRITEAGLQLQIDCETRADAVDEELLTLMRRAGFCDLHFGVESGSPRVLKVIKKARSTEDTPEGYKAEEAFLKSVRSAVSASVRLGLKPTVSIILGLPSETAQEGRESVEFVRSLEPCRYYHNYLEVFAGTEVFETHDKYGIGVKRVTDQAVNRLYRTLYAYDVGSIPIIPERSLFSQQARAVEVAAQVCGDAFLFEKPANPRQPSVIVLTNCTFAGHDTMRWLLDVAGSDTRVVFLWNAEPRADGSAPVACYEVLMPLQIFYWMERRYPSASQEDLFKQMHETYWENLHAYDFRFLDVHTLGRQSSIPSGEDGVVRIYQIEPNPAGFGYYREVGHLLTMRDSMYRGETCNVNVTDTCRWSAAPCPASQLERLIVSENRHVYPCFSGGAVGNVGEGLPALRKRISEQAMQVRQLRGCSRCPANATCSKCLFPHPMRPAEFCRLQVMRLAR